MPKVQSSRIEGEDKLKELVSALAIDSDSELKILKMIMQKLTEVQKEDMLCFLRGDNNSPNADLVEYQQII